MVIVIIFENHFVSKLAYTTLCKAYRTFADARSARDT
jgi:hypothetical protein